METIGSKVTSEDKKTEKAAGGTTEEKVDVIVGETEKKEKKIIQYYQWIQQRNQATVQRVSDDDNQLYNKLGRAIKKGKKSKVEEILEQLLVRTQAPIATVISGRGGTTFLTAAINYAKNQANVDIVQKIKEVQDGQNVEKIKELPQRTKKCPVTYLVSVAVIALLALYALLSD